MVKTTDSKKGGKCGKVKVVPRSYRLGVQRFSPSPPFFFFFFEGRLTVPTEEVTRLYHKAAHSPEPTLVPS